MAVEESAPDHGETPRDPEPQTGLRPRAGWMVRMKIAILGTRGIPARYGGFETFAEELAKRLVDRGHEVVVYCRDRHPFSTYVGARLVSLPTIRHKYFDTIA